MEFLVIVLFVVAIVVVNFVVSRAQRRKKQAAGDAPETGAAPREQQGPVQPAKTPRKPAGAKSAPGGPRTSVEAAREANARLDAVQHQQVYAAIAQGHPIQAVKLYAQFTGVGVRAAGAAVENLAMHPQPFQPPRPAGPVRDEAAAPGETGKTPAGAGDDAAAPGPSGPAVSGPAAGGASGSAGSAGSDRNRASAPDNAAAPAEEPKKNETAGTTPATPEEDEISKWVKDMRPEDF